MSAPAATTTASAQPSSDSARTSLEPHVEAPVRKPRPPPAAGRSTRPRHTMRRPRGSAARGRGRARRPPPATRSARGHPSACCTATFAASRSSVVLPVREEQVPARAEAERHRRVQALVGVRVEREPTRAPAGSDRRAPLLAHAAGLNPRRARADAAPLEDRNARAAPAQLARDRKADDAGPDHGNVEPGGGHIAQP